MELPEVLALVVVGVIVAGALSALVVSIAVRWVHRNRSAPQPTGPAQDPSEQIEPEQPPVGL